MWIKKISVILNLGKRKSFARPILCISETMTQVKINLRFYYQRTWGRYGTSGSLTTASKLISAIPSVCPFSKLGCSDISSALSPFRMSHRFLLSTSGNLLVFYEMLELEVTYSRSRIVSTSRGAVLKRKKNNRKRERDKRERKKKRNKPGH